METWSTFYLASAGAAAALAGLVVVAISVNVQSILSHPALPPRTAATIAALIVALSCSLVGLIPQTQTAWSTEVLALGLVGWLIQTWVIFLLARTWRMRPWPEAAAALALSQLIGAPIPVGGALTLLAAAAGPDLIAAGVVLIFAGAVLNSWVLLVEILR
ncbi:MAG: hypothetical protein ACRED9_02100 [Caulobacteraceae bacterium]